jgi:hypothetical protein
VPAYWLIRSKAKRQNVRLRPARYRTPVGSSSRRRRWCFVYRDDGALAVRQQMSESQHRATPVLEVVTCGYGHAAMMQLFAGGEQPITSIDQRSESLSQRCFREDALWARPSKQRTHLIYAGERRFSHLICDLPCRPKEHVGLVGVYGQSTWPKRSTRNNKRLFAGLSLLTNTLVPGLGVALN